MISNIVIVGSGTAGLISALMLREKYPISSISIISSKDIGIIGVGEGSTEHWEEFMRIANIDHVELIAQTDATVKIGILFKDWNLNEEYVHSVGFHQFSNFNCIETYNTLLLKNQGKFPLSSEYELYYYKNNVMVTGQLKPSNQYHFDTFKLNAFLLKKCRERNINIIESTVKDVKLNDNGFVNFLILDGEERITADLFIDCTGFRKILSTAVGCKWESFTDRLPMNHAIAFPTELDNPNEIEPYTTATALSSGWSWKIPTQGRYGNGYVFCDSYINADEALTEIKKSLNKDVEKAAKDIKFEAGKVDSFWKKNVVSIGLSGSFAEPLEAQSISFTIIQTRLLMDYLDLWWVDRVSNQAYNSELNRIFENVIDYLQLHYLSKRDDSAFWKDKPYKLSEFNKHILELAENGIVNSVLFQNTNLLFRTANWYQILAGLGILNKVNVKKYLEERGSEFSSHYQNISTQHVNKLAFDAYAIRHIDYLNLIKFNSEFRNENRNSFAALG